MKEIFKKKFIWIPALAVVVAGLALVIVLICSRGCDDGQAPAGTVTQSQEENGTDDPDDSAGLRLGDDSDEIMTVDAGGDWN